MSQQYQIGKTATTIHTVNGNTQVIYHSTAVVSFTQKVIVLNHGGWMTNTTKTRMNQASHQFDLGYIVYKKDFNWFVTYKGKSYEFDGSTIALERS